MFPWPPPARDIPLILRAVSGLVNLRAGVFEDPCPGPRHPGLAQAAMVQGAQTRSMVEMIRGKWVALTVLSSVADL